jgi:enolase
MKTSISSLHARQIFDSRGRPTVEVDVVLASGAVGRAAVPSGASKGTAEAHELRDGDAQSYDGLGVSKAVHHVNHEIAQALMGRDALNQREIDEFLIQIDGSSNLARLGANAILGVSLAVCRASAAALAQPLYLRIADLSGTKQPIMPMPMVNILSGGLHANGGMDFQDFLAIPASAQSIEEAIKIISKIRNAATALLAKKGISTLLADEGGLSPGFEVAEQALDLMMQATEAAGLRPGIDMVIAIDMAASSLKTGADQYTLRRENRSLSSAQMTEMVTSWVNQYPIASIEDALDEEDWPHWAALTAALGKRIQLIGDDFFATNIERLQRGIEGQQANGVLIKLNQNGTLTGTLDVMALARKHGYATIVSARSGETEDAFISDLAVGTASGQIKIGSLRCSDRLSKYNQILRIAEDKRIPFQAAHALFRLSAR